MNRIFVVTCFAAVAVGCGTQKTNTAKLASYLSSDCSPHTDAKSCAADSSHQCEWMALGAPCPQGSSCPSGVCVQVDKCRSLDNVKSCVADPSCAWSQVKLLCPVGSNCDNGGFCHARADNNGCACVSPAYCPVGEKCPPMECDCSGGTNGGGTCTCHCPDCAPGQTCPPCDCSCGASGNGGCVTGGTCGCVCPAIGCTGASCPPCSCGCAPAGDVVSGGVARGVSNSGGNVTTCLCPDCKSGETCAPCNCGGSSSKDLDAGAADLCGSHGDEKACVADTAGDCHWYAVGMPCLGGSQTCIAGVCQKGPSGGAGGGSCACACAACPEGKDCPPCACDCSSGGAGNGNTGTACTPPPSASPGAVCPQLACDPIPQCPNGVKKDANGCDTCTCK